MNTGQGATHARGGGSRHRHGLPRGLLLLVLGLAACGSSPRRVVPVVDGLQDPDPRQRTSAVLTVTRERDLAHVPALIELLDDPDPAVRLATGVALRDLTGRETSYEPYAEAPQRRAQVLAWRAWWQSRSEGAAP